MQKLLDTLSRIGSSELSELLGKDTISILEHLDSKQVASYKLAELVVSQFGPEGLLLDKTNRQLLLETLSEDDAKRLCRLLGLQAENPWEEAVACRFSRGNIKTETLFSFFGCDAPRTENETSLSPSRAQVSPQYPLFDHQIIACRKAIALLGAPERPRVCLLYTSDAADE